MITTLTFLFFADLLVLTLAIFLPERQERKARVSGYTRTTRPSG